MSRENFGKTNSDGHCTDQRVELSGGVASLDTEVVSDGIISPKEQPEELLSGEVSMMVSASEKELASSPTSEGVPVLSTGTGSTTDSVSTGSVKTTLIVHLSLTSLMSQTVKKKLH